MPGFVQVDKSEIIAQFPYSVLATLKGDEGAITQYNQTSVISQASRVSGWNNGEHRVIVYHVSSDKDGVFQFLFLKVKSLVWSKAPRPTFFLG